jgi:hypothetical protein
VVIADTATAEADRTAHQRLAVCGGPARAHHQELAVVRDAKGAAGGCDRGALSVFRARGDYFFLAAGQPAFLSALL